MYILLNFVEMVIFESGNVLVFLLYNILIIIFCFYVDIYLFLYII